VNAPGRIRRPVRFYNREHMTSIREYRCEICGTVTSNPMHWFVIQCGNQDLTVIKWNSEAANASGRGISAEKATLKFTSAGGLNRCVRRQSLISRGPQLRVPDQIHKPEIHAKLSTAINKAWSWS